MKQLRIAVYGDFDRWFSYYLMGMMQGAFLNGHLACAIPIRLNIDNVKARIDYFKPDVLFTHMIFSENLNDICGESILREHIHENLLRTRKKWGTKIVYQEGDAKTVPRYPYPLQDIIDLGLINSCLYPSFEGHTKVRCIHFPYFALNQILPSTSDNMFRCQIFFAGNLSYRNEGHLHYARREFIDKLSKRLDMKIFPTEEFGNTRFCTSQVAVSASAILGVHQGFHVPGYLDTRHFQYIGARGLYFHDNTPAMDLFFEDGVHYVAYNRHDVDDVYNKYMYYMRDNKEAGEKIRQQGYDYVQNNHTAKHRVKAVLDILDGKTNKIYPLYIEDISCDKI